MYKTLTTATNRLDNGCRPTVVEGFSNYDSSIGHFNNSFIEYTIILFMVLAGTNFTLLYLFVTGKPLPMLRDISQGCRFLHAANPQIIHGDLRAQNVLVDSKFRAKVADFGLSLKKQMGATCTPFWMAPELLRGENLNTSTDVCEACTLSQCLDCASLN